MLRVANGQGFWGDLPQAPAKQVKHGDIDVLSLEYLAEVTLGILARTKESDPEKGYIPDVIDQLEPVIERCVQEDITIVTSAGGLNPEGCARELKSLLDKAEVVARVATVTGDDCLDELMEWLDEEKLNDESLAFLEKHRDRILSANRYFGSQGIAEAISEGADIVVTGRVTDTALVLGPAVAEYGWDWEDYDRLARGIVAGHLLECGGQATGGNFSGDWESVPELWNLGFPIAEIESDGSVVITKLDELGGTVSRETVSEQLLYELTDPDQYLTPDVTVDFTNVELEDVGENRVAVRGISGGPPPSTDKISVLVETGYQVSGHLTYCGPDPVKKAEVAEDILRRRLDDLDVTPEAMEVETVGYNACHRELAESDPSSQDEVVFRVSATDTDRERLDQVGKQLMGLILTGPPGATGFAEGRPRPKPVIEHHALYRDRDQNQEVEWV